jgi:hypothetical protein
MHFSRFAQSAAVLFLLTIGFAAPAHAQNNKQVISGTWYEDRALVSMSTNSSGEIVLQFTQTPANQFLNITNVSCSIAMASTQAMSQIAIEGGSTAGQPDLGRYYDIKGNAMPETVGSSKYYSVVQNGIFYKFGPGRFPSIYIFTQSSGSYLTTAGCVIVGNLTEN